MSFLFEDEVLTKLLVESKLFDSLSKYAQQVSNETKLIAVKLTKNLMQQAVDQSGSNNLELYVQNLVDLDAYLSYLVRNQVRDGNGKLIAYHDATGQSPPADVESYVKYETFYVLKDALLEKLHELDMMSQQAGNEVMKPFVKGLIEQINAAFGGAYQSQSNLPQLPTDQQHNQNGAASNGQGGAVQTINYKNNDPNYQNVSNKNNKGHVNGEQALQSLLSNLPFQTADALSPYAMYMFLGNATTLVSELSTQLKDNRLNIEMSQLFSSIGTSYSTWNSFVSSISSTEVGGANASAYKTEVPYDRANRPFATLESIFGSQVKAKEATQRLLQMVLLVQQAVASLNRSPQLVKIIGSNVLDHQLRQAKAFADSLTAYAR